MDTAVNDRDLSIKLYFMKVLAIITVIFRHTNLSEIHSNIDRTIISVLSSYGVIAFFVLAGYFCKKEPVKVGMKKIWNRLIVPWLFWGCALYLLVLRTGEGFSFIRFMNHMIGNRSSYYFCSMLLLLKLSYMVLPKTRRNKTTVCVVLIILSAVSLFITSSGILPNNSIDELSIFEYLNPYLNIFNWIGFFSLGILFREYNIFNKLRDFRCSLKILHIACSLIIVCLAVLFKQASYFSYFGWLSELALFNLAFFATDLLFFRGFLTKVVKFAGQNTYPLFFLHYPVLSLLGRGVVSRTSVITTLLKPIACICLVLFFLELLWLLFKTTKTDKPFCYLTGFVSYNHTAK